MGKTLKALFYIIYVIQDSNRKLSLLFLDLRRFWPKINPVLNAPNWKIAELKQSC